MELLGVSKHNISMKILRYKVIGTLQQDETGREAQVGDQVKLFLDQAANPDLPEFVFGIIQPGIRKAGCCDEYSIYEIGYELDEYTLRPDDVINVTTTAAVDVVAADLQEEVEARQQLETEFDAHASNTSNPHSVTKTQVGLGNVDNTSDVNKPVSTAQQTALNLKANKNGDTLTNVIISSGTAPGLLISKNYTGMANTQVTNNQQVSKSVARKVPLAQTTSDVPTALFLTLLCYPDNTENATGDSVLYGEYFPIGTVNGKIAYEGGLNTGSYIGQLSWSLSGYWSLTGGQVEYRKTAANLTDAAVWVPVSSPAGQASGDVIVEPQLFRPGQVIKPSDSTHKLLITSVTSGQFWGVPIVNSTAYADDAAAAAGGVLVGEIYKKTGGTLAWRQA